QRGDETLGLVGAQRDPRTLRAQPAQGCFRTRVGPRLARQRVGVMVHQPRERVLEPGAVDRLETGVPQRAPQQHACAFADPFAHLRFGDAAVPQLDQGPVDRPGDAARAVDQGAVKVEQYRPRELRHVQPPWQSRAVYPLGIARARVTTPAHASGTVPAATPAPRRRGSWTGPRPPAGSALPAAGPRARAGTARSRTAPRDCREAGRA